MGNNEVLVKVEGLSKKFCKDLKTSLWYGVMDLWSNFRGNSRERLLRDKEFWAVKDISFELRRGECLGLIGHNGAGKSTLLKILNGLIKPDAGKVTIKGKVGALIELSAGFNPILSGRENIYNNGAILGFTRKEIDEKVEEIIDFAEIREFIDMPVQNYSSGMKVRLGFAVAAQMQPDVLIIDEVLAVGDLGFALKCFKTIDTILPNTAIIFVSHSMPLVSRICSKAILLNKGKAEVMGRNIAECIDRYYNSFINNEGKIVFDDGTLELIEARILQVDKFLNDIPQIQWNENIKFYFKFKLNKKIPIPVFNISFSDKEQRPIALLKPNQKDFKVDIVNNFFEFTVIHKNLQLSKGFYSINLSAYAHGRNRPYLRMNGILNIQVMYPDQVWEPFMLNSKFLTES